MAALVKYSATAFLNVRVAARDGTELATHVYLPAREGPYPVIFARTPYDARVNVNPLEWTDRGYAYVRQDVRGCFLSEGELIPWMNERTDGEDSLQWIVEQPWCNGSISMHGGSYVSFTQIAAALSGHPALKSISPFIIGAESYHSTYWGGAFRLGWQTSWTLRPVGGIEQIDIQKSLPLREMDMVTQGKKSEYWRTILRHPHLDEFWQPFSLAPYVSKVQAPTLFHTGWFDLFICDAFDLFNSLRSQGGNETVRSQSRIIVGPWPHGLNQRMVADEDFGEAAKLPNYAEESVAFIEHHTTGKAGYELTAPPLRLFIMGANQWRDEFEWPLARTIYTDVFLASEGPANTAAGSGRLALQPSGPADEYDYDPANPVPTVGGSWDFKNVGFQNQQEVEQRADVLVYTSDELPEAMEVTGPVVMKLWASSSAVDTDFTAKLVDLRADGRPMSVTDGIIRAQYRKQDGTSSPLVPGEVYEFTIRCNPTAYVFKKGHRLRVEISSSNFPVFARNLNTGHAIDSDTEIRVARQTIFHSAEYPSRMVLPVIKN